MFMSLTSTGSLYEGNEESAFLTMWSEPYNIFPTLTTLIDRLDSGTMKGTEVIPWGSPVPSFGDPSHSRVATLGINPSNREFVDKLGNELQGIDRRFHTLRSLGLDSWSGADARHLDLILESCRQYFARNPYDTWFRRLDIVLSGAHVSYYEHPSTACHFDLIPYATEKKWSDLTKRQQSVLMNVAGDTLGLILRDSPIRVLVLNGSAVVKGFEMISGLRLEQEPVEAWSLGRKSKRDVRGIAFKGTVDIMSGVQLGRQVKVIGYNHNLQGSFGVSTEVVRSIKTWIAQATESELW